MSGRWDARYPARWCGDLETNTSVPKEVRTSLLFTLLLSCPVSSKTDFHKHTPSQAHTSIRTSSSISYRRIAVWCLWLSCRQSFFVFLSSWAIRKPFLSDVALVAWVPKSLLYRKIDFCHRTADCGRAKAAEPLTWAGRPKGAAMGWVGILFNDY